MSKDTKENHKNNDYIQVIGFKLSSEDFAVDIFSVKEIIRMSLMTRVPNAPKYVVGVINMRGKVIPIIDLCIRFNLPDSAVNNSERKIIVIEEDNKTVGLLVDFVNEVVNIDNSLISPPPQMISGINTEYITSIAKMDDKLIIMLDIAKILVMATTEKTS